MTTARRDAAVLTAGRLTIALALIFVLAFVVPPVLARRLQRGRIERAQALVTDVAAALSRLGPDVFRAATRHSVAVLTGSGDAVLGSLDPAWTTTPAAPIQVYAPAGFAAVASDPWLRALQVNVGAAGKGGAVWVLSAGPNGTIETPFAAPRAEAQGDDIVAPVP